jgi:glucan-binding YG repeat protein
MLLIDGSYYYIGNGGIAVTNQSYWASKTNGLLEEGMYRFDADGKMIMAEELVDENGTLYYYKDGRRINNAGVLLIDGSYYCIGNGAIAVTNDKVWVYKPNGLVDEGMYRFDEHGRMIRSTGIVHEDGGYYYCLDGKYVENAGLIEYEGAYYYILDEAKAVTDQTCWVYITNGLVEEGNYPFGADGKMIP